MGALAIISDVDHKAKHNGNLEPTTKYDYKKPVASVKTSKPMQDVSEMLGTTALLRVVFGIMGNQRKVSDSDDVLTTDADKTFLAVSKTLLDSPELEAIKSADGKMRAWLYNASLPWDMSMLLLPIDQYGSVEAKLIEFQAEREKLVTAFCNAYPQRIQQAAISLKSQYRAEDYPGVADIAAKFRFEWYWLSFGVAESLKKISEEVYQNEQRKAELKIKALVDDVTLVMREKMLDLVTHLAERLTPDESTGKKKVLRDTPVTKLQEFLTTFTQYNVAGDQELDAVVQKARALIDGTSAEAIRNSDEFKEKIRAGMESIKSTLGGLVEDQAGRKFRDE